MFRAVFFDLDDTLVDAMDCHWSASRKAFSYFGFDFDEGFKKIGGYAVIGKRVIDILGEIKKAIKATDEELPLNKLMEIREKHFLKCVKKNAKLYPSAEKAIKNARESAKVVAVVSSGTEAFIKLVLEKFDLLKMFDDIVSAEDVKRGKPFADCYDLAYERLPGKLDIDRDECLVVEDSLNGVKAAKAAGMKVVLVPSKYTKGEVDADWMLKSLKEFDLKMFKE